jgi:23S rRNA pseudouridine955/2504/2580 synthase
MPLLQAGNDDGGRRLDRILRKALPGLPLSALHRLLRRGRILVDGRPAGAADRVAAGSVIRVPDDAAGPDGRPSPAGGPGVRDGGALPEILAEGRGLLFLDKPAGLAVHGPDSLDGRVRRYLENTLPPSLSFRPGPLHRLEKPSSGIVVFAKNLEGARRFSALLAERRPGKYYLALAEGALDGPERWEDTLAGKDAVTWVRPLGRSAGHTLLLAKIETGRTHQIRAQGARRGHPLAGDRKYGGHGEEFFLHAWTMDVPAAALGPEGDGLPGGGGPEAYYRVTSPPPGPFRRRIGDLFGENTLRNIDNPSLILSFGSILNQDVPGFFSQP